jgi:hypothetical protein
MVEIAINREYNDNVETFQSSVYGRFTGFCAASDAKFPSKEGANYCHRFVFTQAGRKGKQLGIIFLETPRNVSIVRNKVKCRSAL